MKTYSEKLRDPLWQKKRLGVLDRDNFTCKLCDATDKTLHVHHLKYEKDPWDIDDKYLITLCDECHETEPKDLKKSMSNLTEMLISCDIKTSNDIGGMTALLYNINTAIPLSKYDKLRYIGLFLEANLLNLDAFIIKNQKENAEFFNQLKQHKNG